MVTGRGAQDFIAQSGSLDPAAIFLPFAWSAVKTSDFGPHKTKKQTPHPTSLYSVAALTALHMGVPCSRIKKLTGLSDTPTSSAATLLGLGSGFGVTGALGAAVAVASGFGGVISSREVEAAAGAGGATCPSGISGSSSTIAVRGGGVPTPSMTAKSRVSSRRFSLPEPGAAYDDADFLVTHPAVTFRSGRLTTAMGSSPGREASCSPSPGSGTTTAWLRYSQRLTGRQSGIYGLQPLAGHHIRHQQAHARQHQLYYQYLDQLSRRKGLNNCQQGGHGSETKKDRRSPLIKQASLTDQTFVMASTFGQTR
ncbi:unnamed protein product, partial [Protopolystoma xenopodis]